MYDRAARDRVIALTLSELPAGMTHWSTRRLAREVAMSETTVWRIWHSANLKPHPGLAAGFHVQIAGADTRI